MLVSLTAWAGYAAAGQSTVAVATNFVNVFNELRETYERESGHRLTLVTGSTGKLAAQIMQGAPYDILLAADAERPRRLVDAGLAVAASRTTYALGRLVLWSPGVQLSGGAGPAQLKSGRFRHIAIANPRLAPYGLAAVEVLRNLEVPAHKTPLVQGESVGQAFSLVASGNADAGFIALAQSIDANLAGSRHIWQIPADLHAPIRQDAVLLKRALENEAAVGFMAALRTAKLRTVIAKSGYGSAGGEN